jgi:hypothetical protein
MFFEVKNTFEKHPKSEAKTLSNTLLVKYGLQSNPIPLIQEILEVEPKFVKRNEGINKQQSNSNT